MSDNAALIRPPGTFSREAGEGLRDDGGQSPQPLVAERFRNDHGESPLPLAGEGGRRPGEGRTHLFGLLPDALAAHLRAQGVAIRDAEARRIVAHAVAHGRDGFPASRPVPRRVEEGVTELVDRAAIEIVERVTDPSDGFVKYLFRLRDGALVEAVRIPLEKEGKYTICLSSQAGCAMGCDFCATGRLGLTRHLEAWEIVAQFVAVRGDAPGEVTGAVFQGQGEPLHNYDNVMRAAAILAHPCGGRIAAKAITISTVGLVPAIQRYAEERLPYRLIVSMTSAVDARRRSLMPIAGKWPVGELAEAVRTYQRAAGGRVTIAWVVMGGINTGRDEVDALRTHFDGVPLRVNLIDVNDARPDGYRRASDEELGAFRDELRSLGVPVVRRYSGGAARHAACGMLSSMQQA
jgi:23S rRNA (adenine2503-C2)-methyltransferase